MNDPIIPGTSEILVVSGLPRSGTSLMMQMLARGGMSPLIDRQRAADVDNPEGYYELEAVKRTRHDAGWVAQARGCVVKVVSPLLYDLPKREYYRIIFMTRSLDEILASQEKMLIRRRQPVPASDRMKESFELHLEQLWRWLEAQPHMQWLEISYNALLAEPQVQLSRLVAFLQYRPVAAEMLDAIQPHLYRNRATRQRSPGA